MLERTTNAGRWSFKLVLATEPTWLGTIARSAGRDASAMDIAPQLIVSVGRTTEEAETAFRASQLYRHLESLHKSTLTGQGDVIARAAEYNLMGSPEETVKRAKRYAEAGVTHLAALIFVGDSSSQTLQQMELVAGGVLTEIGGL